MRTLFFPRQLSSECVFFSLRLLIEKRKLCLLFFIHTSFSFSFSHFSFYIARQMCEVREGVTAGFSRGLFLQSHSRYGDVTHLAALLCRMFERDLLVNNNKPRLSRKANLFCSRRWFLAAASCAFFFFFSRNVFALFSWKMIILWYHSVFNLSGRLVCLVAS